MRTRHFLPIVILVLVAFATATGVFYRTADPRVEYTTARGEQATLQGSGLYRNDVLAVAREGIIWDVVDLVLGVPLLVAAIALTMRRRLRGQLLLTGLLFYFFYKYLMYALMVALNPLFLVYVAIFALCPIALVLTVRAMDLRSLAGSIALSFPRRLFVGFAVAQAIALTVMWTARIAAITKTGRFPEELAGLSTLETQALDLGMVVPFGISTAWLLWRRSPWGYVFTGAFLTFGLMMFVTIPAWIAVPLIQGGKLNAFEAAPFLALCAVGITLSARFFASVRQPPGSPSLLWERGLELR